jgi:hypothetical protein
MSKLVAEGFSIDIELTAQVEGKKVSWTERGWLVRSAAYASAQEATLGRHLAKAEAAIGDLATHAGEKEVVGDRTKADARK